MLPEESKERNFFFSCGVLFGDLTVTSPALYQPSYSVTLIISSNTSTMAISLLTGLPLQKAEYLIITCIQGAHHHLICLIKPRQNGRELQSLWLWSFSMYRDIRVNQEQKTDWGFKSREKLCCSFLNWFVIDRFCLFFFIYLSDIM